MQSVYRPIFATVAVEKPGVAGTPPIATAVAALARKAIQRFLTDEPLAKDRAAAAAAVTPSGTAHNTAAGPGPDDYAGWSKRS
jgi:hypothetical protein